MVHQQEWAAPAQAWEGAGTASTSGAGAMKKKNTHPGVERKDSPEDDPSSKLQHPTEKPNMFKTRNGCFQK